MSLEEQIAFTRLESDLREALAVLAPFERAHTEFKYVTAPMLERAAAFCWKHSKPKDHA